MSNHLEKSDAVAECGLAGSRGYLYEARIASGLPALSENLHQMLTAPFPNEGDSAIQRAWNRLEMAKHAEPKPHLMKQKPSRYARMRRALIRRGAQVLTWVRSRMPHVLPSFALLCVVVGTVLVVLAICCATELLASFQDAHLRAAGVR